jgi:hypothetical protein
MLKPRLLIAIPTLGVLGACSAGPPFDDPFTPYVQRTQTITLAAGNAKEANAAIQTIDPWPAYVYNTRIPGDGSRMADAVVRYEDVSKIPNAPKPISPIYGGNIGISSTGGGTQQ